MRTSGIMIMTIEATLCFLLVESCVISKSGEENRELRAFKEVEALCAENPEAFCGYAISKGRTRNEAIQTVSTLALGDLVKRIRVKMFSIVESFKQEIRRNGRLEKEISWFDNFIVDQSSITLPKDVVPAIRDEWLDNKGVYHVSMIVFYKPDNYPFHQLLSMPFEEHQEVIEEFEKYWAARSVKRR